VPALRSYAPVIWDYWRHFLRGDRESLIQQVDGSSTAPSAARPAALRRKVRDKVVVVTGATSGIGRECALRLARAGAQVVLVARTVDKLDETLKDIAAKGGHAQAYSCDISSEADCERWCRRARRSRSRRHPDQQRGSLDPPLRAPQLRSLPRFRAHHGSQLLRCAAPDPGFPAGHGGAESGHIINISSIGVLASPPRFSAYVASKAALDAFSHCAAPEYAAQNIIFTTIHMPLVRTPMIAPTSLYKAFPTLSPEQARDLVMKAIISKPKRMSTGSA
jgi:NAD(P)-dependent dehydrogenase (short-subunit alcohol dehydrogenase family)